MTHLHNTVYYVGLGGQKLLQYYAGRFTCLIQTKKYFNIVQDHIETRLYLLTPTCPTLCQ